MYSYSHCFTTFVCCNSCGKSLQKAGLSGKDHWKQSFCSLPLNPATVFEVMYSENLAPVKNFCSWEFSQLPLKNDSEYSEEPIGWCYRLHVVMVIAVTTLITGPLKWENSVYWLLKLVSPRWGGWVWAHNYIWCHLWALPLKNIIMSGMAEL